MHIAYGALAVTIVVLISCNGGAEGGSAPTAVKTAPTATVALSPRCALAGSTVVATILWSEPVIGFDVSDISVSGGSLGSFSAASSTQYALSITAGASGTLTVDVILDEAVCVDAAGDASAAAEGSAAIAYAPWAGSTGNDGFGVWAELTVSGNGDTAIQRFRLISPGTFMMGSPVTESGNQSYGTTLTEALHQVSLTRPYWIADSECTQRMWKVVMNSNPAHHVPPVTASEDLNMPVESVSHNSVQAFLAALNLAKTDLLARLPTEAEWEYAARAGTSTPFSLSSVTTDTIHCSAWMHDAYISSGHTRDKPTATKSLPPNPWGLYEIHGNVQEWCADWHMLDLGTTSVSDPIGPASGAYRVYRSGAYHRFAEESRSASRSGIQPFQSGPALGFRLAASAQPSGGG